MRKLLLTSVIATLVLAGLVGGTALVADEEPRTLTVMFPSTTSLYEGAQVKVLGVRVGTVESIQVEGTAVRVEMTYDPELDLPADVQAVVVPPSVVGDRFVQLAPVYAGGPVLPNGAELGTDRSGIPLELDDTYRALDQLAADLGPQGANADGALSRLISASADSLRGRGRQVNETVRQLADALAVLASGSDDVNGTTTNLARLNRQLAGDDATIRSLVANLVSVSGLLTEQRQGLTSAVTGLDRALDRVATFTRDTRGILRSDLADLTSVAAALRRHTAELSEVTDLAPVGLVNLWHTYSPKNWDPSKPYATGVDGRTGSQNLHAVFQEDLDVQLAYTMTAFCAALPAEAALQLRPFCTALEEAGGNLGRLFEMASGGSLEDGGMPFDPTDAELEQMLREIEEAKR